MKLNVFTVIIAAACLNVSAAGAQGYKQPSYGQGTVMQQGSGQNSSGDAFSFQGDQIQPMPDQRRIDPRDQRYSQTYQQQQNGEIPKPGGGCLRYGAVGAAGGHLAGHGVLGAIAGCATGAYVRHRDKARIQQQYNSQR
jgi:hypothetical protein